MSHHHSHAPTYYTIFAILILLVGVTIGVAMVPLGIFALITAMAIASLKAGLILAYFMHLRDETPLVRVFALAGFVWLGLMMAFFMGDYLTRGRMAAPPASQPNEPVDSAPAHA